MANEGVNLLDSDFFYGLFIRQDAHHEKVKSVVNELEQTIERLFVSNSVLGEAATLLSKRGYHKVACEFLNFIRSADFDIIYVDDQIQLQAEELFTAQKGESSIVDCCNVVIARRMGIERVLSFDKFYKNCGLIHLTHEKAETIG